MPDEKGGSPSGLKGFAQSIYSETQGAAQKAIALWIVGGLSTMVALAVAWLRGSTAMQLFLLGSVCTVLAWALALVLIGIWRYLRRKPPEPTAVEPQAPQESVKRLKEAFGGCRPALVYVAEYLRNELCLHPQTEEQKIASGLIVQYPLRQYEQDLYVLESRISAAAQFSATEKEFEAIKGLFFTVLNSHYMTNTAYLIRIGKVLLGSERFLGSEELEGLRRRHDDLIREIRRAKEWPDLAGIANWAETLADLMPRRRPDPPPSLSA